ncbi:DUF397 domain-containing protein [Streptomyces verrucosisporus]|uniref:DUF397 domain-containing protein n=1 Tax=Streptomyces verrucosisporus TaxID=1695161 RepID=UPI0019D06987|nr:DUF397 domain-containing protein [Streptomyces verrucosisporus]MBN3929167.1 DUF397 domain-containing protein [Streptomyces verrucosisporus]
MTADSVRHDLPIEQWRKSSYSNGGTGNCVEVAEIPGAAGIAVRDSKNLGVPPARVSRPAWAAFLSAVARGTALTS